MIFMAIILQKVPPFMRLLKPTLGQLYDPSFLGRYTVFAVHEPALFSSAFAHLKKISIFRFA